MIYFTLSNFYENFLINNFMFFLNKTQPQYFREKISFIQASGNFPYSSWNGDINNCAGLGSFYSDFETLYKKSFVPLRFNFSNILLEEHDYHDAMNNLVLDINENGSNLIEISNLELMDYILEKNPTYKFVFSKNAHYINQFTPELLNIIIDFQKFELIGIPDDLRFNFDFLKEIKKRNLLEITVNSHCPKKCKFLNECILQEHQLQLEYSGKSLLLQCDKGLPILNTEVITLEDIKKKYLPLGITHFTFANFPSGIYNVLTFYLNYFIKDEYHQKAYLEWEGFIQNNG